MTGANIIGSLLRTDADLQAIVPIESIMGGRLPDNLVLPAILVRVVSVVDRQPLKRAGWARRTDRISATVRARSYAEQSEVMRLIRACCASRTGDIGGGRSVSVTTAGTGPDLNGPGNSFEQAQDFRVSFDEPA